MSMRDWWIKWRVHRWPKCQCGQMKVAPRTATEIGGWRHTERECWPCDAFGNRRVFSMSQAWEDDYQPPLEDDSWQWEDAQEVTFE